MSTNRLRVIASSLFIVMLLVYALFPTRTYYWDGVLFSLNIEAVQQGDLPVGALFHPNHLLYSALGYVFYQAFQACGFHFRAIAVLQGLNIALSALSAWTLFRFARRLINSASLAVFCATMFAFGATWWKFSTDADAYVITLLFLLLTVQCLARQRPGLLLAAICQIVAMLFHELAVFAYIAVIAAIAFDKEQSKAARLWRSCSYILSTAVCVAIVYFIAYQYCDRSAYPTLLAWITSRSATSQTGHALKQFGGYALSYVKLFAGGKLSLVREFFSIAEILAFAVCGVCIGWAVYLFRQPTAGPRGADSQSAASRLIGTQGRTELLIVWAWLIPYAIFFLWWEPASAFYKLFIWPPIVLLIGIYSARQRPKALVALAIGLAAWNFGAFIFPHSHAAADPVLALAQRIDRELPKNATVYYESFDPDDWYLAYFAPGRKWVKLPSGEHSLELTSAPVCLETTALDAYKSKPAIDPILRWDLINRQHNVRLECLSLKADR